MYKMSAIIKAPFLKKKQAGLREKMPMNIRCYQKRKRGVMELLSSTVWTEFGMSHHSFHLSNRENSTDILRVNDWDARNISSMAKQGFPSFYIGPGTIRNYPNIKSIIIKSKEHLANLNAD